MFFRVVLKQCLWFCMSWCELLRRMDKILGARYSNKAAMVGPLEKALYDSVPAAVVNRSYRASGNNVTTDRIVHIMLVFFNLPVDNGAEEIDAGRWTFTLDISGISDAIYGSIASRKVCKVTWVLGNNPANRNRGHVDIDGDFREFDFDSETSLVASLTQNFLNLEGGSFSEVNMLICDIMQKHLDGSRRQQLEKDKQYTQELRDAEDRTRASVNQILDNFDFELKMGGLLRGLFASDISEAKESFRGVTQGGFSLQDFFFAVIRDRTKKIVNSADFADLFRA